MMTFAGSIGRANRTGWSRGRSRFHAKLQPRKRCTTEQITANIVFCGESERP
jgi:hypothetical protein